jgi:two-component system, chemotaxis family, CheB/CheR fusion protein
MSMAGPPDPGKKTKLRVLVVDDQKDTARMLRLFIGSAGHEVQTAESKAAALELAGQTPFDVLVADVRLPDGTGYELMSELRARTPMKGIIFSGLSGPEEEDRSRAAGFSAFLVKPFDLDRLVETVERVARE